MSRETYKIFSEGRIANLVLKNRLVRSATCEYKMTRDGKTTGTILNIYKDLAAGGVGMIISSLMAVTLEGKGVADQICIYNDNYISEISKIADVVHETDSKCVIIAQLCHSGRQVTYDNGIAECVGPSQVESPILIKKARELTISEIEAIIESFVDSIIRVKKAGFDGAQLHAAHGYLLSSFLSPYTNRREDKYGGSVENRTRIIKDILALARKKVGDFPILIKINCEDHIIGGISKDSISELVKEIEASGVDAIEVSGGMWDCLMRSENELGFRPLPLPESRTRIDTPDKQSYYYEYVKGIKTKVPLILVGGNRNIELLENLIQEGNLDFISLSRPLIAEPGLPNRWHKGIGKETTACVSCNACVVFKEEYGCAFKRRKIKLEMFEERFSQVWKDSFK
jgi:2,4-dienoyl-CoA reductase-like NADH-dependent reductase (Old Yellow Enzyme family)